jgi:serine/threonine-protein kinase ATR
MHVDFGCLFDKGLTLEVPEMVPFRLTQNVVDAFGVSGVEGAFRRAAEMTLQVSDNVHLLSSLLKVVMSDLTPLHANEWGSWVGIWV